jgi:NADH-quinone oxidoreductase subunit F
MSEIDLAPLQAVLPQFVPQGRAGLLPALHAAQRLYGYLPEAVVAEIARSLGIPLADASGVIEFYSMFYPHPVGKNLVRVCTDPACALRGGEQVLQAAARKLGVGPGETTPDGAYTLEQVTCLGLCEHAPAALVNDTPLGSIDPARIDHLLASSGYFPNGRVRGSLRMLTERCGKQCPRLCPATLQEYELGGGYLGLRKALAIPAEAVVAEIKDSGLVGRGGAAFPAGVKWEGARNAPGQPKYVICNADESEPGTFKDRILLGEDPHAILEGMLIAAYAIGAEKGYFYLRGEYAYLLPALEKALGEARQAGYLGENILGSDFRFEIELRLGAGAYICGEETALFESIEGKRGFPRIKPPFPTTHGLFGKPTLINNVETLANVPIILRLGANAYRETGTEMSPGTKLFCVSGDVVRPGLYEVPFGITIRHLLFDQAKGLPEGRRLQAILFGGAAGAFATPDQLDIPLTFEDLRQAGLPLGSGVVTVFDETRDLRDVLYRLGRFFAHESCGKCYPCQIGTARQAEILARLRDGKALPGDFERLQDVGWTMTDASLCGLGQTAAAAVLSAMKTWPEMFR